MDPKINGYQRGLASMVYKFFSERTKGSGIESDKRFDKNKKLAEELNKPIIKSFKRRKAYYSFKDNIWGVDVADMSLCVIDLFSRYSWVIPLKNKKGDSIVEGFKSILTNSTRKLNKIWVDNGKEFYNNKFNNFLKNDDIEMYSTHNEGKLVVAERLIKTLKNKIYKHLTTIGENVYFNVLDDIVKNYNNTIHNLIKMKPKEVKNDNLTEYIEEFNKKILNLRLVIMSESQSTKTFFLKVIYLIGLKKFLLLIK